MRYIEFVTPKMSLIHTRIFVLMGILVFLAACGPADATPTPPSSTNNQVEQPDDVEQPTSESDVEPSSGYPAPTTADNSGYPAAAAAAAQLDAYPAPPITDDPNNPHFQFDTALTAGMTTVTGKAPPNLALVLVDITFGGGILGSGRSDDQGTFSIGVTSLPESHRIGLTISEATNGKTMDETVEDLFPYRGDQFMNVPNVGVYFETALVQP